MPAPERSLEEIAAEEFRPSKFHLSNAEVRACGTLAGGAFDNISRELLDLRRKAYAGRSALLSMQGEMPKRPEWSGTRDIPNGVYAVRSVNVLDDVHANAHFTKLEFLLLASYAEIDKLQRERGDIANALVDVAVLLNITSGSYALTGPELLILAESAQQAIEALRSALSISFASGKQEGRKEALEAVVRLKLSSDGSSEWAAYNNALDGSITAILALPKVGE